jgi:hypothetical protein
LVAGLDGLNCVLVSEDDPRVQVFDSRDNPELKRKFWSINLGCPLEVELCAS